MTLVKCPLDESPASDESSDEMDGRDLQEDEEEERQVMSEVHLGCPPAHCGPYVSRFTVSLPLGVDVKRCGCLFEPEEEDEDEDEVSEQQGVSVDRDGDLVLARHRGVSKSSFSVTIRHSITSSIPNVGFQIWKAELLLADFLLHKMFTSSSLDGIIALELGAGTGLAGLLLAHVAKTVFLTDYGDGILDNCEKNVERNSRVLKYQGSVYVRELDWFTSWPPARIHESSGHNRRHSWTSSEVDEAQTVSILLAADVIYSENLTDVFFSTVQGLMSLGSEKILYLALEKRYNFSLCDLDIVANGYSHFRDFLMEKEGKHLSAESGVHRVSTPSSKTLFAADAVDGGDPFHSGCGSSSHFIGECLDLSQIPQYIDEYERGNDLELWQIRYRRS